MARHGDAGSAAIAGFAAAVAIFAIAFYGFMSFVQSPAGVEKVGPLLRSRAEGGLDELLSTPGRADDATWANAWHKAPDKITRFGLLEQGRANYLDPDKLRNLTRGGLAKDAANQLLDYEEAREAMGLGTGYDFHLRTYPLLTTLEDGEFLPVKGMRVAYVGNFSQKNGGGSSDYPVEHATTVQSGSNPAVVWINVTVENNGTEPTVFQAEYEASLRNGKITDTGNTRVLGNGTTHQVSLQLYKHDDWDWGNNNASVRVKINDPSKVVADFWVDLAALGIDMGATSQTGHTAVVVDAGKLWYTPSEGVEVFFDVYDHRGRTVKDVTVNITVKDAAGAAVRGWQGKTAQGTNSVTFPALPAGVYALNITQVGTPSRNSTDRFEVTATAPGDFTSGGSQLQEGSESPYERGLLASLVEGFVNATYEHGGDVYPDSKKALNNDLAANITAYDILVVGSEADHNSMTSAAAKYAVRDFVADGGLLIVLGSLNQQVTWLQPLFHATLTTSGDGVAVPDETHPILHVPQELAWKTYPDTGRTWEFNSDDDASHFTHVIVRDGGGNKQKDVLAVSKPGHFGNGSIVLTGWVLFQLTQPQDHHQAKSVLYNFLLYALSYLYIDLGPPIPDHAEVGSSSRMATAPHPALRNEDVLVRLILYVFR